MSVEAARTVPAGRACGALVAGRRPGRAARSAVSRRRCDRCGGDAAAGPRGPGPARRPRRSTSSSSPPRPTRWRRYARRCSPSALAGARVLVVAGGETRQDSVAAALAALPDDVDVVLVHDAARAARADRAGRARVAAAVRAGRGAVVPGLPVHDTVKRVGRRTATAGATTLGPGPAARVQTPQGFVRAGARGRAHRCGRSRPHRDRRRRRWSRRLGVRVVVVAGSEEAFKVTRPLDLLLAEAVLAPPPGSRGRSVTGAAGRRRRRRAPARGRAADDGWPAWTGPDEPAGCAGHSDGDVVGARLLRRAAVGRRPRRPRRPVRHRPTAVGRRLRRRAARRGGQRRVRAARLRDRQRRASRSSASARGSGRVGPRPRRCCPPRAVPRCRWPRPRPTGSGLTGRGEGVAADGDSRRRSIAELRRSGMVTARTLAR